LTTELQYFTNASRPGPQHFLNVSKIMPTFGRKFQNPRRLT
jgi:hypothetical protein